MPETEPAESPAGQDLFLVELRAGDDDDVQYAVAERFLSISPGEAAMGVPWSDLALLFRGKTLRAVPMPGRRGGAQVGGQFGQASTPGPGFSPSSVEVNVLKIGKSD